MTLIHQIYDFNRVVIDTNSNGEQVVLNFGRFNFGCRLLDYLNFQGSNFKLDNLENC